MKIILNISDVLLAKAKSLARYPRLVLSRLIEEGLRMRLHATETATRSARRDMPVFDGKTGLAMGIGGISTREMLDAVDHAAGHQCAGLGSTD